jgi:hypothetical protein
MGQARVRTLVTDFHDVCASSSQRKQHRADHARGGQLVLLPGGHATVQNFRFLPDGLSFV